MRLSPKQVDLFCSTIIPTIGRPELARAVESVLAQNFTAANFEIIVVNDSGYPLAPAAWQESKRVQVIDTNRRERSVARNTGAAVAKGQYLHFLDDDDWLLPGALETFWQLAGEHQETAWLYSGSQLVDRAGEAIIKLDHQMSGNCFIQVMAGEWIPLQSSLIKASAFFAGGGFNPLIAGPEDVDLCRRITLHADMTGTAAEVACIGMGEEGSSTDYNRSPEKSRWAREAILNESGVFKRMRASANSAYWWGRIVRVYLTSLVWNLKHRRLFTAASRAIFTIVGLVLGIRHFFFPGFWQAIAGPYESRTFLKGFEVANRPVERRRVLDLRVSKK